MARLLTFLLVLGFCGAVFAEDIQREGRYAFVPTEDGFFRLDTQSGEVSLCAKASSRGVCRLAADDRIAYETEIDVLQGKVIALEGRILALELASGLTRPDDRDRQRLSDLPDDTEIDQFMDTAEHVMRRFFGFVQELKQEFGEDSL